VQICMADTAIRDLYGDIVVSQLPTIEPERFEA
jgi:hypothetical protein